MYVFVFVCVFHLHLSFLTKSHFCLWTHRRTTTHSTMPSSLRETQVCVSECVGAPCKISCLCVVHFHVFFCVECESIAGNESLFLERANALRWETEFRSESRNHTATRDRCLFTFPTRALSVLKILVSDL